MSSYTFIWSLSFHLQSHHSPNHHTCGHRAASDRGGGMKVGEVKGLMYEIPRPSTPSRSSSIRPYAAYELDDWWCSHWLERRGGNGVDELLEVMVVVEREKEMNRVERGGAWAPDTPSRTAKTSLPQLPPRTSHLSLLQHAHA